LRVGRSVGFALLLTSGVFLAARGSAETPPPPPRPAKPARPPAQPPAPTFEPVIEPKAIELLKATSSRLAAAKTLAFRAVVTYESPSRLGPPLAYTTLSEVTLQRPDKLRVITAGDGPASEFYYDGKTIMAFEPAQNLVAVADAKPTIDAALLEAFDSAAIYFPFTDVIVADPYGDIADGLKVAFTIGQSRVVAGTTTDMVAFANNRVFVQMWIDAEDKLPRLIRAVYRDDPSELRHQLELSNWQLDLPVTADVFASAKAAGAKRIGFARPDPKVPPELIPKAMTAKPKAKSN
jgi:hypothetical protein